MAKRSGRWWWPVMLAALAVTTSAAAREPARGRATTPYSAVEAWLLRDPQITKLAAGEPIRLLSVSPAEADKAVADATTAKLAPGLVDAILVTYRTNRGLRARIDVDTRAVTFVEQLRGRPTSSSAERDEAANIIQRDRREAALLRQEFHLQGGFVVDPPVPGRDGRFLEFHLADRGGVIVRELIVDLGTRTVVAIREASAPAAGSR